MKQHMCVRRRLLRVVYLSDIIDAIFLIINLLLDESDEQKQELQSSVSLMTSVGLCLAVISR